VALTHLVDTSVLKRLARPEVDAVIAPLAGLGQLGRARIGDLEIGCSARNVTEWDQLQGSLDIFDIIETTQAHLQRAMQVQRLLADRSQRGRKIPDLLVAAAAEARNHSLLLIFAMTLSPWFLFSTRYGLARVHQPLTAPDDNPATR